VLIAVSKKAAVQANFNETFSNDIIATFSAYKLNFLVCLKLDELLVQNPLAVLIHILDQKHIDHRGDKTVLYIHKIHDL
jgi:hypothetical protein